MDGLRIIAVDLISFVQHFTVFCKPPRPHTTRRLAPTCLRALRGREGFGNFCFPPPPSPSVVPAPPRRERTGNLEGEPGRLSADEEMAGSAIANTINGNMTRGASTKVGMATEKVGMTTNMPGRQRGGGLAQGGAVPNSQSHLPRVIDSHTF
eukprot:856409-Rhodomonas_salina.2